jgi:hypothetical protein
MCRGMRKRAGGFAPAEYYTVDLVRSSLNPLGSVDPAAYNRPGLMPMPMQQQGEIGFDPLKVYNVVRRPGLTGTDYH